MHWFNVFAPSIADVARDADARVTRLRRSIVIASFLIVAAAALPLVAYWLATPAEQCELAPGDFSRGFSSDFRKTRCVCPDLRSTSTDECRRFEDGRR